MATLAAFQLFALTGVIFLAASATTVALLVRAQQRGLAEIEPLARRRTLGWLATAPFILAGSALLACVLPSALALVSSHGDHCGHHAGHPHLCPWHPPMEASLLGWSLLLACTTWLALRSGPQLLALFRGARAARELLQHTVAADRYLRIETTEVFAASVGLTSPVVAISRGLEERLAPAALEAVITHEQSHVRRRDALLMASVRLLWSPLPARLSQPLLGELSAACEEAADRDAANAVGDELIVADAILLASRAAPAHLPASAMGFGAHATRRRVQRLMHPATGRARFGAGAMFLLVLATLALAEPLHHTAETLLGVLLH